MSPDHRQAETLLEGTTMNSVWGSARRIATVMRLANPGWLTRHTHATLSLQAGVYVKIVSVRLGHSSVTITLDTYSYAIPGKVPPKGLAAAKAPRVSLFGSDDQGNRIVWDLAAKP
jgi:integrase